MLDTVEKTKIAKPFLKWAGGKSQLIVEIERRLPKELLVGSIKNYVEPFIGGGALFFYMAQKHKKVDSFYLFDTNDDLISCYKTVKNSVELLIDELFVIQDRFLSKSQDDRQEMFYNIREKFNSDHNQKNKINAAAELIFINKTCFNGLYRVNRKGYFNVPFGKYENPTICDEDNLRAVSEVLQKAKIFCGDFSQSREFIDKNTFVYFDPPYRPISQTASFTSYSKDIFCDDEQKRLASFCRQIDNLGAKFLLSNSDPQNENPEDDFFDETYKEFNIERVKASRAINCKGSKRGQIKELLITNY